MTLRKITIDKSGKYIAKSERHSKPNAIKNNSNFRKQNKLISQIRKFSFKKFQHKDSDYLNEQ